MIEVLEPLGILSEPEVYQQLVVDLEGDGTDEVVIVARHVADDVIARPGDYSVVLLRKIIEGEWQTAILETSLAEPDSPYVLSHSVAAVADLNGDGKMEIVVDAVYYEGAGSVGVRVHQRRPRAAVGAIRRLRGLMLFAQLVAASAEVASTRSRKTKTAALARLLRDLEPSEIPVAVGLLAGNIRQGRIGVGYAAAFGVAVAPVAEPVLTLMQVDEVFDQIPTMIGAGSQDRRARILEDLFARSTEAEQDFLRRTLTGEVRQGALAGLMVDAVAEAYDVPAAAVRRALMLRADLGAVARTAAEAGVAGLAMIGLQVLSPVQPMLASPAASIEEAVTGEVSVEWKLDGARIQVHRIGR